MSGAPPRLLDPPFSPRVADMSIRGHGFAIGLMSHRRCFGPDYVEPRLDPEVLALHRAGRGRSLWFRTGGELADIARVLERQSEDRRSDLWVGVGLAAAHVGGLGLESKARLVAIGGDPARRGLERGELARRRSGSASDAAWEASLLVKEGPG
jgi:hypothetical protein